MEGKKGWGETGEDTSSRFNSTAGDMARRRGTKMELSNSWRVPQEDSVVHLTREEKE